jgi:hypothetical protein
MNALSAMLGLGGIPLPVYAPGWRKLGAVHGLPAPCSSQTFERRAQADASMSRQCGASAMMQKGIGSSQAQADLERADGGAVGVEW